jgi:hypothetical protein
MPRAHETAAKLREIEARQDEVIALLIDLDHKVEKTLQDVQATFAVLNRVPVPQLDSAELAERKAA